MQPAAMDALEVEQQGQRLRLGGRAGSERGHFPAPELRQRRIRAAAVIDRIRKRPGLDKREDSCGGQTGGERPPRPHTLPPRAQQEQHRQHAPRQVQGRAIGTECVQNPGLQPAEPQGGADHASAEERKDPPQQTVQRTLDGNVRSQEKQANQQQGIQDEGSQTHRYHPEYIGPGTSHHTVTTAACAAACHRRSRPGMDQHPDGERQAGCTQEQCQGLESTQALHGINTGWRHPA